MFLYPDLILISLTMIIIWIFTGFKSMLSVNIDKSCRVDITLEQRWKLLNISWCLVKCIEGEANTADTVLMGAEL